MRKLEGDKMILKVILGSYRLYAGCCMFYCRSIGSELLCQVDMEG